MRNSTIIGLNVYKTSFMTPELAWRVPYIATLRDVVIETRLGAIFDDRNLKVYIRETSDQNFSKHPYVCAPHRQTEDFSRYSYPPQAPSIRNHLFSWASTELIILIGLLAIY